MRIYLKCEFRYFIIEGVGEVEDLVIEVKRE